jgi:transcriptional regulator with XRE-family HTH domain
VRDPLCTFAANLRRLRRERGLSQEQLSEAADLHMTHVSKIERARCEPGVRTVSKLASALRVSPGTLFERIDGDDRLLIDRPERSVSYARPLAHPKGGSLRDGITRCSELTIALNGAGLHALWEPSDCQLQRRGLA